MSTKRRGPPTKPEQDRLCNISCTVIPAVREVLETLAAEYHTTVSRYCGDVLSAHVIRHNIENRHVLPRNPVV